MEKKKVSYLGIALILAISGFCLVACMSMYKVAGPNVGHVSVCGMLLLVAWMCEMMFPDEAFVKLVLVLSGIGFMGITMMGALFRGVPGQILQAMMFLLMVGSMGQLILSPVTESTPDG